MNRLLTIHEGGFIDLAGELTSEHIVTVASEKCIRCQRLRIQGGQFLRVAAQITQCFPQIGDSSPASARAHATNAVIEPRPDQVHPRWISSTTRRGSVWRKAMCAPGR